MSGSVHPVTLNVVRNARIYRTARKLSVQKVADLMTERGVPITRSVLANFECGRRPTISIAETVTLADVLGVPLADLIADAPPCTTCHGVPPSGFTCNACGTQAATDDGVTA